MRVSYRVITPASVAPPRSNLLSPLDIIHYSTFDGVCQEEILVFFFSTARSHLHLGHYLPLAQPTGSHPLLTLCSIAQVSMNYNRQDAQVSGKINKKICVKKLLTKLLAGCIMVNSGRDARGGPAIIPAPGAFVNRENYTKNEGNFPLIFVRTDKQEMCPAFRSV